MYFSTNRKQYRIYVDEAYVGLHEYIKNRIYKKGLWAEIHHDHYDDEEWTFLEQYEGIIMYIIEYIKTNIMDINKMIEELVKLIPQEQDKIKKHIEENNGEILGHIYFGDEFTNSLIDLLKENKELDKIKNYCNFIEYMWENGDEEVLNIVDVTILESLSDDREIWNNFGKNISKEFKKYINKDLIPNNIMMNHVKKLS